MAKITPRNLRHSYCAPIRRATEDWALKQLTLRVGMTAAPMPCSGPSGCGKTTLLNLISGPAPSDRGRASCSTSRDVTDAIAGAAQHCAGVPVPGHLRHHDRLRQSRLPAAQPAACRRAEVDKRVREIAAHARDSIDLLNKRASGLTADGKQKISLGRGLVRSDVNVIMFDEPLTVIDPHLKWVLRSKLQRAAPPHQPHHDLCHARPDRGADLRRPGGGHEGRRDRADRHAGRAVRAAAATPSSAISSARPA